MRLRTHNTLSVLGTMLLGLICAAGAQQTNWKAGEFQGLLTGDPQVDAILVSYQRPPQLGSA